MPAIHAITDRELARMPKLKCERCPYFERRPFDEDGFSYCQKLKHPLENGYAMQYHAKHCGENP